MSEPSDEKRDWESLREKVIGLGAESVRKSYYPELQKRLHELQESEARFHAIFDSVNDAIFVQDFATGAILDVNRRMCDLYGYSREEALRLSIVDLSSGEPPYDAEGAFEVWRKVSTGEPLLVEWHAKDKSGRLFWVEVSLRRAEIDGKTRLLAVVRDITERKQADEALRQEKNFSDTIISSVPGTFFVLGEDGKFVRWNRSQAEPLGYTDGEMAHLCFLDILAEENRAEAAAKFQDQMHSGIPNSLEVDVLTKSGIRIPFLITAVRMVVGDEKYVVGFGVDITDRKRMEEEKRKFYCETILSVTDGKLNICNPVDLEIYTGDIMIMSEFHEPSALGPIRHTIEDFCGQQGIVGIRLDEFMTGVGEAITNALKHGCGGTVWAGATEDFVWVRVTDKGPGMESLILPKAVLRRGFSTKPSLGLGYSIMIDVADRILLNTGSSGTDLVLIKNIRSHEGIALEAIPDTWGDVLHC